MYKEIDAFFILFFHMKTSYLCNYHMLVELNVNIMQNSTFKISVSYLLP